MSRDNIPYIGLVGAGQVFSFSVERGGAKFLGLEFSGEHMNWVFALFDRIFQVLRISWWVEALLDEWRGDIAEEPVVDVRPEEARSIFRFSIDVYHIKYLHIDFSGECADWLCDVQDELAAFVQDAQEMLGVLGGDAVAEAYQFG
ncbi:MAG: hypothetical protein COA94_05590 [Rickettsiales bacterium]|nr:MAG: hypothetical protein COA94_05590 [Rickettsiales bacterium]